MNPVGLIGVPMMRWMLGMLLGVFTTLLAQVPNQEVVLSASAGSRVGVGTWP